MLRNRIVPIWGERIVPSVPDRICNGAWGSSTNHLGRVIALGRLMLATLYLIAVWVDAELPVYEPSTTLWTSWSHIYCSHSQSPSRRGGAGRTMPGFPTAHAVDILFSPY